MTTAEDITSLRRRLNAVIAARDQLIIQREERVSTSTERRANHHALRAAVFRTRSERERVNAEVTRFGHPTQNGSRNGS